MGVSGGPRSRLVGRASERELALRMLAADRGVLFAGPPGVGKSSLARSVAEDFATGTGARLLRLTATATEPPIPFGAIAPLAPDLGAKPGRPSDSLALLQAFRGAILRRARGGTLLFLLDDAHRLDGPSADLVLQLVTDGAAKVVATVDPLVPAPSSVRALWKEELVGRIDLSSLGAPETVDLVTDLLVRESAPSALPPAVRTRLRSASPPPLPSIGGDVCDAVWRMSRGVPLYASELVKEGLDAGRIVLRDGVWRLDSDLETGPRLSELISERLGPLRPAERETLDAVAVGEPVPFTVLLRLARTSHLETLERRGLIAFELFGGEQVVRAGHPVIGAVVRRSLPAARSAVMRLRLAEAMEADGRAEAELVRVATWRLDGGVDPGGEVLLRASVLASGRQDWRAAARLAEAARSRGQGCEAVLALAGAYRALGRFTEALEVLGDDYGDGDDQKARMAVLRSTVLFFGLGRLSDALDVLAAGLEGIDDPSDRAWLKATRAGFIGLAGRPAEAVELAEKLLADPGLSSRAELTARAVLSIGLTCTGRTERALEVIEDIPAGPAAVADLPTWSVTARMLAHRLNGHLDALEEAAQSSYDLGLEYHDPRLIGPAATAMGWAALERGHLQRAVSWFREASVALRAAGALAVRVPALLGLAEALALSGEVDESRQVLEEARPAADRGAMFKLSWVTTSAWVSAAQGAVSEALKRLVQAAADAQATGQVISEIRALQSAVRLGSAAPAGRLAELACSVEGSLIQIVADHAAALEPAETLGDSLDSVAERYAELGCSLYAAEAAAQASRAHEAAGRTRRAAASAARGHFLLGSAHDDGPPPLGLALALAPPELTRREREVAMLASGGLPSPAIAARLCLSVRTVETHLARVYVKLGIGGRSELATALAGGTSRPHGARAG